MASYEYNEFIMRCPQCCMPLRLSSLVNLFVIDVGRIRLTLSCESCGWARAVGVSFLGKDDKKR